MFGQTKPAGDTSARRSSVRDMTSGPIVKQIILFALPLMLGNVFQMLYNTVDSIVVGNFVSTEALAAVGSTTSIVNMLVFFFNGFSIGASVVIAQYFGAKDLERLHKAVETTMMMTFILSVLFSLIGYLMTGPMLRMMATPDDVFDDATIYLKIYFVGFSGLFIYNMGSGILRAVGDTTRPLLFLILTSVLNILLDLLFVLVFRLGIAGVAYATILAQAISAVLTMLLLTRTDQIYRMSWKDLGIDRMILGRIVSIGLPAAIQSVITAFSNTFVQAYINVFGSSCMAGWSCYNKLDQFIMLPMQSMANAATTFVSQNIGAKKIDRADRGTILTVSMAEGVTLVIAALLYILAPQTTGLFSQDASVIEYGVLFLRANVFFLLFNCVNHVLAGALRGRGDSRGPMIIMLTSFVAIRQIYLFIVTHYVANTPLLVGIGYPVGWTCCSIIEVTYFFLRWNRKTPKLAKDE